ncbi:MAG: rhodanese-like domain-containing protein [Akkermansiaceae bacterium]
MTRLLAFFFLFASFAHAEKSIFKEITPREASRMLKAKKPPVIIDIRTPEEFKNGHLKGAKLVDYRKDFEKNLAKLDRNQIYIFHCRSGGRSTQSLPIWKKLGFKNVLHLKSGYLGWTKAKLPVVVPKTKSITPPQQLE